MRILILGVGDAFTRKHFGSSAVIESPWKGFVLIDCPDLIHRALHEASVASGWQVDASRIDDVIITHLHGDHCNGLESFGFHRRILRLREGQSERPRLHVMQQAADRLWERLAPAMDRPLGNDRPSTLADYFDVRILTPGRVAEIGGLKVECRVTRHTVPTIGLVISDGERTLGWSGDTPFEQAHIDWLAGRADVIVHECNLGPAHTHIEELNALPESIKSRMRLIHLPDDFDPRTTKIAMLREGEVLRA